MNGPTAIGSRSGLHRTAAQIAVLSLLCIIAVSRSAMAQPQISLKANGIQSVELLPTEYVPANVVSAITAINAATLLPYTVVVRNTGSLPITGLDIRYEIFTKGDMVVNNFFYGSPVDLASTASFPVIAPGLTVVIGPSHVINEQLMSGKGPLLLERHRASAVRRVDLLNNADRVTISIDCIIRSDGILRGPDRSGTLLKFQQEVSGYKEFRNELLRRFEKGESDADIVAWLKQTAGVKLVSPGKNQPLDQSIVMKKVSAQQYLSHIAQGRQHAWHTLTSATPELRFRRVMKVRREVEP